MSKNRIADRLGYYDETGQYVPHRVLVSKAHVPFSKRVRNAWHNLNRPREVVMNAGKGVNAVLLLSLIIGGLLIADQWLKPVPPTYGAIPVITNTQWLFRDDFASNNLGNWESLLTSYQTHAGIGVGKGLLLGSNSTHSAIAISKTGFGIDTVAGHELAITFGYCFESSPANSGTEWGVFLTRNSTLPATADYDPRNDRNTILALMVQDTGGGAISTFSEIQNDPRKTIIDGIFSGIQAGQGPLFSLISTTQSLVTCANPPTLNTVSLLLNFTGNAGTSSSASRHWRFRADTSGYTETNPTDFPQLQMQGGNLYMVVWQSPCTAGGCSSIFFPGTFSSSPTSWSFSVQRGDPSVSVPVTPPQAIDTGGFFGPVIKALIAIGVFILTAIAAFLGYVADAFVTAMNAVGNFFGLGAIGTAIRNALVGVGTWVSNVFGNIFGQAINIATAISNTLSALLQVTGTFWTQLTSWLSALSNLLSLFWPFIAFFGVGLPFSSLVTVWLILGIIMSYNSQDGVFRWMRWTWIATATIFNLLWAIGERAFDVILKVKDLLVRWI